MSKSIDLSAIEARANSIPATSGMHIGELYGMYVHAHAHLADDCLALIARVRLLEEKMESCAECNGRKIIGEMMAKEQQCNC